MPESQFDTAQSSFCVKNSVFNALLAIVDNLSIDLKTILGEVHQLHQELTLEGRLLQTIALGIAASQDFDCALKFVLRQFCEATDWALGEAWIPNAAETHLECSPVWYSSIEAMNSFRTISEGMTFQAGIGLPGRVWLSRQPEWIQDVSRQPQHLFLRGNLALETGLRAGLGVPIVAGNRVLVVLTFFMLESREEDRQCVELVKAIAAQLGSLIEYKQVERALKSKEDFLRLVLDNIPLFIFWKDRNSVYLGCNHNFAQIAGFDDPEDVVGKTEYDMPWQPEEREAYLALDRRVINTDTPYFNVIEPQSIANGRKTWSETSKIPLHDDQGNVIGILGIFQDVTERKQAEESLQQAEAKYRSIFENVVEGIFQTTPDGHYITANPMLAHIYGYASPAELMVSLTDIEHQLYVDPTRREAFRRLMQQQDAVLGFESQVYRKDGSIIWISENARAVRDDYGKLLGYEGTVEDISKRKQAEAELLKRDNLLQAVAEATNYLLTEEDFSSAIRKALALLGRAADVDRVYIYKNHLHPDTGEFAMSMRYEWTGPGILPSIDKSHWQNQSYSTFQQTKWYETLASGHSISGLTREFPTLEREILERDAIRSVLLVPILVNDQFWGFIGFDECRSERHWFKSEESILIAMAASIGGALRREQAETTIRYQAFHDLLTGLPNRAQFNNHLPISLNNARREGQMLAVMFLDLDRFKTINDTLGHAVGDQLLQAVASRLSMCLREGDVISRWGGDEFTLLLPRVAHAEDASKIAQRILDALKPPFRIEGQELYITSSIGIALHPGDGDDVQTLLRNADAALYCAKEQGRNNFQFYVPALTTKATELLSLESRLHYALEWDEFILYYQPQIDLQTGQISRMEALVRWQHPELGLIPPKKFIPLAEESGLITAIDTWVLETACQQNKDWQKQGLPPCRISVNLSARHFQKAGLIDRVKQILHHTQLKPQWLELEITETAVMQNVDLTSEILRELHDMGLYIALDDFGAGYSSLGYLKKFPLHTLKIDRSFIFDLNTNPQDVAIISAMITLAQGLNLDVVAEGVETETQVELLRSLNCTTGQGYCFSRPLPLEEATEFIRQNSAGQNSLRTRLKLPQKAQIAGI